MAVATKQFEARHPDGTITYHRTGAAAANAQLKSERKAERAAQVAANQIARAAKELAELVAEKRVISLDDLHAFRVTINATGERFRVVQGAGLFFRIEED